MEPTNHLPDAIYAREIRRLRASVGVLTAIELALITRAVVDGMSFANGLAEGVVALLLIASLRLWRTGRRLKRNANPSSTSSARAARVDRGHTRGSTKVS
jgi:hypothetical protein